MVSAKSSDIKLSDADLEQAAECLKTLAHPNRLRMVHMMLHGRYTVGQLADACHIPSPMASEHLRLLQRCGMLASVREGKFVFYEITEPALSGLLKCIEKRFASGE